MNGWQYAGPAELVAEPGSFLATEGGVPVVVTRARGGELRALLNVCRYRGHLVASGLRPTRDLGSARLRQRGPGGSGVSSRQATSTSRDPDSRGARATSTTSGPPALATSTSIEPSADGLTIARRAPLSAGGSVETRDTFVR
jgi:hypothetical protein